MKIKFIYFACLICFGACNYEKQNVHKTSSARVYFQHETNYWQLYRNNKPYYIKGAYGIENLELIKQLGGNSIVVYDKDLSDSLLNIADSLGLSVTVTLDIGKARFKECDYSDTNFILPQRRHVSAVVKRYYNHPAILFWVIGNEVHIMRKFNVSVWREVNELSKLVHSIDPYHPTTTSLAAYPTQNFEPFQLKMFAPDLDFISLNVYDFAPILKRELGSFVWGIDGPIVITEWAGEPFWVAPIAEWGVFWERSSTSNAAVYYSNYCTIFGKNKDKCVGGYVFYWGQKQERTHTIFSLIHDGKYKTQALEHLQMFWSGTKPSNWCPRIEDFYLDGFKDRPYYVTDSTEYVACIKASDPDSDSLFMRWDIRAEGEYLGKVGGEHEKATYQITQSDTLLPFSERISFSTPKKDGAYRLFVYVYDNHDYVATANIPFYVVP